AGKRQIADSVDRLVANALVGETHSLGIEDAVVRRDDGILEARSQRVARAPQLRHVAHKAESACPREVAAEHIGLDFDRQGLTADQRMIELDLGLEAEPAQMRSQFAVAAVLADL